MLVLAFADFWQGKLSICSNDWTGAAGAAGSGNDGGGERGMAMSKLRQLARERENGAIVLFAFN